jgi:hypothetical protein
MGRLYIMSRDGEHATANDRKPMVGTNECGQVLTTVTGVMIILCGTRGLGRHIFFISSSDMLLARKYYFIGAQFWLWAAAMVRISVALMLLRVQSTRPWQVVMYGIVVVEVLLASGESIFELSKCTPFAANWDQTISGYRCVGQGTWGAGAQFFIAQSCKSPHIPSPLQLLLQLTTEGINSGIHHFRRHPLPRSNRFPS